MLSWAAFEGLTAAAKAAPSCASSGTAEAVPFLGPPATAGHGENSL
jgi:hypothetical protein